MATGTIRSVLESCRNWNSYSVTPTKGEYHKTRHGFPILERLNPATVRARCPYADALLNLLAARLRPEPVS